MQVGIRTAQGRRHIQRLSPFGQRVLHPHRRQQRRLALHLAQAVIQILQEAVAHRHPLQQQRSHILMLLLGQEDHRQLTHQRAETGVSRHAARKHRLRRIAQPFPQRVVMRQPLPGNELPACAPQRLLALCRPHNHLTATGVKGHPVLPQRPAEGDTFVLQPSHNPVLFILSKTEKLYCQKLKNQSWFVTSTILQRYINDISTIEYRHTNVEITYFYR